MVNKLRKKGRNEGRSNRGRNGIFTLNRIIVMSDQSSVEITIVLTLGDDEILNESTNSFEIAHQIVDRQQRWLEKEQALAENRAEQELEEAED